MEHWKRTIERANRCFMLGELIDAREAYLQALALAQVLFERWADADEAVAACVISHHNLADLHLRLNQRRRAPNTFAQSINGCCRRCRTNVSASRCVKRRCARAAKLTSSC